MRSSGRFNRIQRTWAGKVARERRQLVCVDWENSIAGKLPAGSQRAESTKKRRAGEPALQIRLPKNR
jgi:hypothetical protein